jgi:hypothetical protein
MIKRSEVNPVVGSLRMTSEPYVIGVEFDDGDDDDIDPFGGTLVKEKELNP